MTCPQCSSGNMHMRMNEDIDGQAGYHDVCPVYDCLDCKTVSTECEMEAANVLSTNNLWGGGIIPDKWKPQLPDNAKFIDGKQGWVKVGDTWCMG